MKTFLGSALALFLVLSVSCSNGGSDTGGNKNNANNAGGNGGAGGGAGQDNIEYKNVQGTIRGQWLLQSDTTKILMYINDAKMKLIANCENNQSTVIEVAISIAPTKITYQESKTAGQGNCSFDLKKGVTLDYTLNGDDLTIVLGEKQLPFTRVQTTTAPPTTDTPAPGGNGGGATGAVTIELYAGTNCTGTKSNYSVGMNCGQLSGTVTSLKSAGQQCQNMNQGMNAVDLCQYINQQNAGQ